MALGKRGPFIYQKDPKYRKDPEIPERPVNGSTHARVKGGGAFDFNIVSMNKTRVLSCKVTAVSTQRRH